MLEGIKYTGVPSREELSKCSLPSESRMKKGKVAVIECVQEIPCNPCEGACKFNAIEIGESITSLPKLHEDKCTGCGICIAMCPGLAICVIDKTREDVCVIDFPYEYYPLPKEGDKVEAVNREGKIVCEGKIIKIRCPKNFEKTNVISIEVPIEYSDEVRSIKRL